jgi:hypothetical protein
LIGSEGGFVSEDIEILKEWNSAHFASTLDWDRLVYINGRLKRASLWPHEAPLEGENGACG